MHLPLNGIRDRRRVEGGFSLGFVLRAHGRVQPTEGDQGGNINSVGGDEFTINGVGNFHRCLLTQHLRQNAANIRYHVPDDEEGGLEIGGRSSTSFLRTANPPVEAPMTIMLRNRQDALDEVIYEREALKHGADLYLDRAHEGRNDLGFGSG